MHFRDAYLKIDRANKHIADLDALIATLPDRYISVIEINPNGGNQCIKFDLPDKDAIRAQLATIAGDAVHNLKCALDYSWLATLNKLAPCCVDYWKTKFPIHPTRDGVQRELREKGIDKAAPDLVNLMLDKIGPYDGGNFAIRPIHRFDIGDKHRLLVPIMHYSSVSGIEAKNDGTGEIAASGFTMGTTIGPPFYINIWQGWSVKNKGRISTHVLFRYGIEGKDFPISEPFSIYSGSIFQVVETLETFSETVA